MMNLYFFKRFARHLTAPLGGLALLLASAGAAQAQTPATFAPLTTYATGGSISLRVVTGDLNADGRLDAVTANITSNNVSVFLNSGNGTFAAATRYNVAPGGVQTQGVTLGDVNADGRLDIVTANNGNNTIGVLLNQGAGIFGTVLSYATGTNTAPRNVALSDVNGDGVLDAVTGNSGTATTSVLLGLGGGAFGAPTSYATSGLGFDVALGDVTADGRLDIVTANYATNSVNVLPGLAGGTFGTFVNYATGVNSQTVGLRLGDVNTDGRLDVVASNQNSTISVLLGQAGGTLATTNYSTGAITGAYAVGIGDVNGDGLPDLVPGNFSNNLIGVLLGQASGFGAVTTYNGGNGAQGVALADVNADGKLDVLTANRNDNTLGVLLNSTNFVVPTLTSVSPTNGPVGTSVTLTGASLTGATGVSFNGTAAATFAVVNATTITATVPPGATTGNITVTTSAGTSNGVAFAVNPTVAISSTAGASGGTTSTAVIPFVATFSQSVTGFVAGDITVVNGSVLNLSGSGTTYSFTVAVTTPGSPTTVGIAANVAQTSAGTGNVASATYSLQYNAPVTSTVWTGSVSTDWFTAANWTDGVPTSSLDATIPAGAPRYPVLTTSTANVKDLILKANASLTQSGGTLAVAGQGFAIDGTFSATGGLLSLAGSSEQRLGGTRATFWDL
ncbi:FG-GAP-like repeat-containing protein, partial [Hymenobacter sp. BT635]